MEPWGTPHVILVCSDVKLGNFTSLTQSTSCSPSMFLTSFVQFRKELISFRSLLACCLSTVFTHIFYNLQLVIGRMGFSFGVGCLCSVLHSCVSQFLFLRVLRKWMCCCAFFTVTDELCDCDRQIPSFQLTTCLFCFLFFLSACPSVIAQWRFGKPKYLWRKELFEHPLCRKEGWSRRWPTPELEPEGGPSSENCICSPVEHVIYVTSVKYVSIHTISFFKFFFWGDRFAVTSSSSFRDLSVTYYWRL